MSATNGLAAIIIVSDRGARGERADATAPRLAELLAAAGYATGEPVMVADERAVIAAAIRTAAAPAALVITSGGTGIGPRDVTPEATRDVVSREIPGFGEAMRAASRQKTPFADLSRATAGVLGRALVINLPGSPRGAAECLQTVLPMLAHATRLLRGAVVDCQAEVGGAAGRAETSLPDAP